MEVNEEAAADILVAPTDPGVLTTDETNRYVDFLNRKALSPTDACPVCGHHLNLVNEYVFNIPTLGAPAPLGRRSMPVFATVCYNCSYVRFFSRLVADAVMEAEAAESPELPLTPAPETNASNDGQ